MLSARRGKPDAPADLPLPHPTQPNGQAGVYFKQWVTRRGVDFVQWPAISEIILVGAQQHAYSYYKS